MNSENLINDVESILDDLYPKTSYDGDFITVPNTIIDKYKEGAMLIHTYIHTYNKFCFKGGVLNDASF